MKYKFAQIASVCFLLAACSQPGTGPTPSVDNFKVGQTTIQDVEAVMGTPTHQTTTSTGFTMLVYASGPVQAHPASFVFSPDGKLESYNKATGQNGAPVGLTASPRPLGN